MLVLVTRLPAQPRDRGHLGHWPRWWTGLSP